MKKGLRVAVVGATGMVGHILLDTFEKRRFPVGTLLPFSSGRRKKSVRFKGRNINAPGISMKALESADLVVFVSADEVSAKYAEKLAKKGVWVIDDSAAFRMRKDIPLCIPEVNGHVLTRNTRLIAGPNCTVTGVAVAGFPLHKKGRAKTVRVASYQAVSGAGRDALLEFYEQTRRAGKAFKKGKLLPGLPKDVHAAFPAPINLNILPHIGRFDGNGESGEETKVRNELRKIWSAPKLEVSATTVRVPVVRGHSLAVWMQTRKKLSPAAANALMKKAPGVKLWKNYPTVRATAETYPVHIGRIRNSGIDKELAMWIVSDNLLKGAALNSVHIAEHLLKKGWLKKS
jgi:aspartate-semialdehyde dehydrogenase